jgi:hypothetical protein
MALNYIRMRFADDRDGTGKLWVRAEAGGFSGESDAYFGVDQLEAFAEAVQLFPLPVEDNRRSISGGFGANSETGESPQEHFGISVYLADAHRGYVGVQVRMATKAWPQTRPESKKQAVVEIITTYEPLARFGKDLIAVLRGKKSESLLQGDEPNR